MAEKSTIEWTDTTWNPVTGCTKISAGCDNCYAERFSERFRGVAGHPFESGFDQLDGRDGFLGYQLGKFDSGGESQLAHGVPAMRWRQGAAYP